MKLSGPQKMIVDAGVKKLTEWIKSKKNGVVILNEEVINNYLKENDYNYKITIQNKEVKLEYSEEKENS